MKIMLITIVLSITLTFLGLYYESTIDPYEPGPHFDYTITCEGGFVYKSSRRGIILILKPDGTPLKCGEKIK